MNDFSRVLDKGVMAAGDRARELHGLVGSLGLAALAVGSFSNWAVHLGADADITAPTQRIAAVVDAGNAPKAAAKNEAGPNVVKFTGGKPKFPTLDR